MADLIPSPALTEPVVVPSVFCTGVDVITAPEFVRLICWEDLPTLDADQPERRIVSRLVMPLSVARELVRDLRRDLSRGRH